jgi:uncharacterized cupredoxin-like copper-binding protein
MKHQRALGALMALLALGAAACGDGKTARSTDPGATVIDIDMTDNAFAPNRVTVKAGQEVTFRFRNDGKVVHEAIVGTADEQAEHEAQMNDKAGTADDHGDGGMATMEHSGTDDDGLSIEPGMTGQLTHTFEKGGRLLVGCHEPGHYKAGMKLTVEVS